MLDENEPKNEETSDPVILLQEFQNAEQAYNRLLKSSEKVTNLLEKENEFRTETEDKTNYYTILFDDYKTVVTEQTKLLSPNCIIPDLQEINMKNKLKTEGDDSVQPSVSLSNLTTLPVMLLDDP